MGFLLLLLILEKLEYKYIKEGEEVRDEVERQFIDRTKSSDKV